MGHQRLGSLPGSRKWRQVVELISGGGGCRRGRQCASAAAELSLMAAAGDPAVRDSFFLLTQIPLAARKERFATALRELGLKLSDRPSLVEIVSALADAVDRRARSKAGRTDLGEIAQLAAAESLNAIAGRELTRLFGTPPEAVRHALGGLGTVKQFAVLARDFFARLTRRHLDYYLSRELSKHVGINSRFQTIREHKQFEEALDLHCRQTSRIIEEFSGQWFSKQNYEGGIDQAKAGGFVHVAFDKIRKELRRRRDAHV
jgi:hypothetical protein